MQYTQGESKNGHTIINLTFLSKRYNHFVKHKNNNITLVFYIATALQLCISLMKYLCICIHAVS